MKVFLDTNVLVAAFATRGLCEDVLRGVLTGHELILGTRVLEELEQVLMGKLRMPPGRVASVTSFLESESLVIDPKKPAAWPKSDPDDRWIAAAALEGGAEIIVSGDRDLLEAAKESPIPIVSPREFWERLRRS